MNTKFRQPAPLKNQADMLARKGRYGDTMLVHMNPTEVDVLRRMTPGGQLTINPDTGQPEAFLPLLLGLVGSSLGGAGMLGGINALAAGAIGSGLGATIETGSLKEGLKAGVISGLTGMAAGKLFEGLGAAKDVAGTGTGTAGTAGTAGVDVANLANTGGAATGIPISGTNAAGEAFKGTINPDVIAAARSAQLNLQPIDGINAAEQAFRGTINPSAIASSAPLNVQPMSGGDYLKPDIVAPSLSSVPVPLEASPSFMDRIIQGTTEESVLQGSIAGLTGSGIAEQYNLMNQPMGAGLDDDDDEFYRRARPNPRNQRFPMGTGSGTSEFTYFDPFSYSLDAPVAFSGGGSINQGIRKFQEGGEVEERTDRFSMYADRYNDSPLGNAANQVLANAGEGFTYNPASMDLPSYMQNPFGSIPANSVAETVTQQIYTPREMMMPRTSMGNIRGASDVAFTDYNRRLLGDPTRQVTQYRPMTATEIAAQNPVQESVQVSDPVQEDYTGGTEGGSASGPDNPGSNYQAGVIYTDETGPTGYYPGDTPGETPVVNTAVIPDDASEFGAAILEEAAANNLPPEVVVAQYQQQQDPNANISVDLGTFDPTLPVDDYSLPPADSVVDPDPFTTSGGYIPPTATTSSANVVDPVPVETSVFTANDGTFFPNVNTSGYGVAADNPFQNFDMTGGLTPEQMGILDPITATNTTPVNPYVEDLPVPYTTPFNPAVPVNTGVPAGTNVNASGYRPVAVTGREQLMGSPGFRPVATAGFNPGGYGASANAGPFGSQPFTPGVAYNPYG